MESQFQFVTTSADDGSSGSLRQAVASCPTNGMIAFAPGLSGENLTLTDEIVIDHNLFIDATALPGGVTVSGGGASIFNITNNQSALSRPTVYISHLLVTGNSGNDSAIENYHSILTLDRCTFTNNASAIFNYLGASMTVNQCTIAGNGPNGGITSLNSSLVVNQSTIVGNTTTDTFYGGGGGITSFATSLSLSNSIVASNTAPSSEPQNVFSSSIDTFTFTNNLTNGDPHLAPIGNYGGPLPTMPPLPGSPAIDAGNDSAASQFTTDQRGYSRLAGAHVDIGAVEVQSPATNAPVLQNIAWSAGGGGGGGANTFQFTFTNAPNTDFTVLTATNVALPLTNWTVLGEVMQPTPGQYQFTDRQAATNKMRFYRVRSP